MPKITINENQFHYVRSGEGPPVVLLHGFTGSVQTWKNLQNVLEKKFEIISIDMIGHGLTAVSYTHMTLPTNREV